MSRATEIAKAEAEAVESESTEDENPDAEPVEPIEPDDTDEEEAEEAEPSALAVVENIDKALTAEQKRHANALRKALGEQWEHFAQCPLCQVDGYAMPYQPGEIGPEQRDAIMTVMGESGPTRSATHPTKIRCDACDGWGKLYTGSRDPAYEFDACVKCAGSGTMDKIVADERAGLAVVTQTRYPWDEPAPTVMPNADKWGRHMGHPDYGIDPNEIVATVRAS